MARILPYAVPATTTSPTRRVPFCTSRVATTPRPFSTCASMTVPKTRPLGLALRSALSATRRMASRSSSSPMPSLAETSTIRVSPPHSSGIRPSSASWRLTSSGRALGLSILLMATTMGTRAARAWSMASRVWGMTPSSAATTNTTMSAPLAPRARNSVKAAWPGVSRKVMVRPLYST